MRQKEAKIEPYATMDGTNLCEPIVSRNRQFKQKSFTKKETKYIQSLGKKILKRVSSF